MAAEALRVNDAESHCRLSDPTGGVVNAPIVEISLQGALINSQVQLETNAYIDITLALKDLAPRQLFAHVVSCGGEGLRLRWLHFDPGEEAKLRSLLENFAKVQSGAKAMPGQGLGAHTGTRRVVRPRTDPGDAPASIEDAPPGANSRRLVRPSATAITPFSDAPPSSESGRVGTRRVVRPSQQGLTPFADMAETPLSPPPTAKREPGEDSRVVGEDSRTHQVVIEPTDRFEKLVDIGPQKSLKGTPATDAAPAPAKGEVPAVDGSGASPAVAEGSGGFAIGSGAHGTVPDESNPQPAGGKTSIIGKDGRMDIGASIRSHAKTVRASELAARHERVRVLNMGTIRTLIQEAVEEAATHLTRSLGEAERKRLLEEAEEGFQERLKAFQVDKQSAEEKAKRLNEQLEAARNLLEDERKRAVKADQFTVSAEGLGEIEDRFKRLLTRSVAEGGIPPSLEEELRKLIAHILDSEREKIRLKELEAQSAKIELLERKINRLAGTLEETEKQRDEAQRFASFLEANGGGALRNVFTAGLKDDDPNKTKKLELMKKILEENRALRSSLGIALADPNAPDPEPVAPAPEDASLKPTSKGGDTSSFRREIKEEVASLKKSASELTPAPSPVVGDEAAGSGDEAVAEEAAEPQVNPDDEPWEIKPLANTDEGITESGIKRIAVPVVSAPPLSRGTGKPGQGA